MYITKNTIKENFLVLQLLRQTTQKEKEKEKPQISTIDLKRIRECKMKDLEIYIYTRRI